VDHSAYTGLHIGLLEKKYGKICAIDLVRFFFQNLLQGLPLMFLLLIVLFF
jgi:hypothetical protein